MSDLIHPALPFLAGAAVLAVAPARARAAVALAAAAAAVACAWSLPSDGVAAGRLLGFDLVWLRSDALGRAFALVFALIGGLGATYALAAPRRRLLVAAFVAAAAGQGIVLAGDWITLYAAWEVLALASFALVLDGGLTRAGPAAYRYLLVHLTGGALLLAGIVWHRLGGGSPLVEPLSAAGPGLLILLAFAVNAAIPPLHAWLTDAYPESSPAGTVFLSAFATKAAVYALARVFAGTDLLVPLGVAMALHGVVYAVLENDVRRLLGYHIVSQVGYMVAGVGLGTPLALSGVTAHAFCHILYKGLLLMGAGAVVHATGRRRLTDLGGLGRAMPATATFYMIGALSISGAPLLNGFVSKSMIVAAAEELHRPAVVWLLGLAAVGTFLSTGLKLPWFTFAGPPPAAPAGRVPAPMLVAMAVTAALCALTGTFPGLLFALLPFPVTWQPYTVAHVMEMLQVLAGTALGFFVLLPRLRAGPAVSVDTDRIYRMVGRRVAGEIAPAVSRAAAALEAAVLVLADLPLRAPQRELGLPVSYGLLAAVAALGIGLGLWGVLR